MPKAENDAAPPPLRGRPRDPARFQRILEAASRHFSAHGLERASVDAIAAEAGVSKMTIYSNFASKQGLFAAVVRARAVRILGGVEGVEALDPKQPRKALLAIGAQFLTLAREAEALGKIRRGAGAAGSQPARRRAFY